MSQDKRSQKFDKPLAAALAYAKAGMKVLPLHHIVAGGGCSCGRQDCKSPGKHPTTSHGKDDASSDASVIRAWFAERPSANVGVVTGNVSGIFVVDRDPRNGGDETFSKLLHEHGDLPVTLVAETGGGGGHYVFRYPTEEFKFAGKLGAGVDVKSDGGYIVVDPSNHASGNTYSWIDGFDPGRIAEAPAWLLEMVRKDGRRGGSKAGKRTGASPRFDGDQVAKGGRSDHLTSVAGVLREEGKGPNYILEALLRENQERCSPPLDVAEVESIAKSVCRYPQGDVMLKAPFSDLGNAKRFTALYSDNLRYVVERHKWILWRKTHWEVMADEEVLRLGLEVAKIVRKEAACISNEDDRQDFLKRANKLEKLQVVRNMIATAQTDLLIHQDCLA